MFVEEVATTDNFLFLETLEQEKWKDVNDIQAVKMAGL